MATLLPTISCMVLYKNERIHLERILPKIIEAFDEVILVTNIEPSTDGSDELVANYGINPQRMRWVESFAVARQFGLDRCTGDYCMWMDCDDDILTNCGSWAEAKQKVKQFLASSKKAYYSHRIYHADQRNYWQRENWFHKDAGVRVRYPCHEIYEVNGEKGEFPPGLLDRSNAPLKPDYDGKLWRYFDMIWGYLRDSDPHDLRCRYYLAREFRGPPVASVALFWDYVNDALASDSYRNFGEESWSTWNLYTLRAHIPASQLHDIARRLLVRHPFQFMAHVLYNIIQCELEPSVAAAYRFHRLIVDRANYQTERTPQFNGWYYQKALNHCGYAMLKISITHKHRDLVLLAIEVFKQGLMDPASSSGTTELIQVNLKIAKNWLAGFMEERNSVKLSTAAMQQ